MLPNREINLDILRGLMSSSIMTYHFLFWHHFSRDYNNLINKIGLYGVSIFYILSGITFYIVYQHTNFLIASNLKKFWIKRFFRIFPLFWLVCVITVVVLKKTLTFDSVFLNITGLFSIINPGAALCTGGWSIGNELFFYILFPVILLAIQRKLIYFGGLLIVSIILFTLFGFLFLNNHINLENQWNTYINPLNQVLFFVGGIFIGFLYKKIQLSQGYSILAVVLLFTLFSWYPIKTTQSIELVTNFNRLTLSFICLLFTYFFIQISINLNIISKFFIILGEISYSIYLIHPIVFFANSPIFKLLENQLHLPAIVKVFILIIETFILSWFSYNFFEKKFTHLSKQVIKTYIK